MYYGDRSNVMEMLTEMHRRPEERDIWLEEAYRGTGVMIALHLSDEVARRVSVPNGTAPGDMHCTLVYLGNLGKDLTDADIQKARELCGRLAHSRTSALKGQLGGMGRFSASKNSDNKDVLYLSLDSPELPDFRQRLVRALERAKINVAKDHGYSPHVTLSYIDPGDEMPFHRFDPLEVAFGGIGLSVGGKREMFPFRGMSESRGFGVIAERTMDRARAQEAAKITDSLIRWFRWAKRWDFDEARQLWKISSFQNGWRLEGNVLSNDLEDLWFYFDKSDFGFAFQRATDGRHGIFKIGINGLPGVSKHAVFTDVAPYIPGMLRDRRQEAVHEMTHFIDWRRLGAKSYEVAGKKGREAVEKGRDYYNSAIEMNAYYQMAAEQYEADIRQVIRSGDEDDIADFLFQDADYYWDKFSKALHSDFWRHLTSKNKQRIKKRAGQMFMRLKKDAAIQMLPSAQADLASAKVRAAEGDEDAIEWGVEHYTDQVRDLTKLARSSVRPVREGVTIPQGELLQEGWSASPPSGFLEGSRIKDSLWHGTDWVFREGDDVRPDQGAEYGIYLSPRRRYARGYGRNMYEVFVNIRNPKVVEGKDEISPRDLTREDVRQLESEGFDSIVVTSGSIGRASEVIAFYPRQVHIFRHAD